MARNGVYVAIDASRGCVCEVRFPRSSEDGKLRGYWRGGYVCVMPQSTENKRAAGHIGCSLCQVLGAAQVTPVVFVSPEGANSLSGSGEP